MCGDKYKVDENWQSMNFAIHFTWAITACTVTALLCGTAIVIFG